MAQHKITLRTHTASSTLLQVRSVELPTLALAWLGLAWPGSAERCEHHNLFLPCGCRYTVHACAGAKVRLYQTDRTMATHRSGCVSILPLAVVKAQAQANYCAIARGRWSTVRARAAACQHWPKSHTDVILRRAARFRLTSVDLLHHDHPSSSYHLAPFRRSHQHAQGIGLAVSPVTVHLYCGMDRAPHWQQSSQLHPPFLVLAAASVRIMASIHVQ